MSNKASGKKRIKVSTIIIIAILVLIIGFIVLVASSASMMSGMTMANTTTLEKKTIENTVSMSGFIESRSFTQVSSQLSYKVESVNVEAGDKVKEGDVLATINTDDLQNQILQQQASINSSNVNTEYSLSDAEKRYNEASEQIENGTYPEIRNAKMTLENAESALEDAKEAYDEQLEIAGTDKDSRLTSAKRALESAEYELECAFNDYTEIKNDVENEDYSDIKKVKDAYDDAKKDYDSRYHATRNDELTAARDDYEKAFSTYTYMQSLAEYMPGTVSAADIAEKKADYEAKLKAYESLKVKYDIDITEDTYEEALAAYTKAKADLDSANSTKLKNAERSYERAKTTVENAKNSLKDVESGNDTSIENYRKAVDDAQKSVNTAKESYELAVKNANSTLASLKASADREKVLSENDTQLINLEILKEKLDDCVIKAPCDGTVTAVNVTVGSVPTGVMFIIEDTDDLKMVASVKEYSIGTIAEGIPVTVSVPSINKEFEGEVINIAPAAQKGADGKSSGTASFDVEVSIDNTADSGVLIGMTSKCTALTGSAENVFAVGYDTLVEDADGTCYVFEAQTVADGTAVAKKIIVQTGFESDAEVEIISDELTEGMTLITNAGDMTDGAMVILMDELGAAMTTAEQ